MGELPDIAALLAPHLARVPRASVPAFLCQLERTAAGRYREWATQCDPVHRERLLACAAREDEIADRVLALLPPEPGDADAIEAALPGARELYRSVLATLPLAEQWRIQAHAERQGAAAWRGIAARETDASLATALEEVAKLEERSADELTALLALAEA